MNRTCKAIDQKINTEAVTVWNEEKQRNSPEDDPDGRAIAHCVFCDEAEYVANALNRIPPAQAEPVKWVSRIGDKVLVEATINSLLPGIDEKVYVHLVGKSTSNNDIDIISLFSLSQLRPLPVTQEVDGV